MNEIVEYHRHVKILTMDDIMKCTKPLIIGEVDNERGIMEINDTPNLKADFANKFIGGGVLHGGNVQEEIMFMESPEAICAMVFCTVMDSKTTIRIFNMVRYSKIKGYGHRIQFSHDLGITCKNNITAMDAIVVGGNKNIQYEEEQSLRDMNKVYSAIDVVTGKEELVPFITGKWGCGAFGGDWRWKYVQQMVVCSIVGRPFVFTTFHDENHLNELTAFNDRIRNDPPTVSNFMKWVNQMITGGNVDDILKSPHIPTGSKPFESRSKDDNCVIV